MKRLKIVEVTWEDSASLAGWHPLKQGKRTHKTPFVCRTVGLLLHRDDSAITLAMSDTDEGQIGALWRIPGGMVRKVRVLGKTKPKKRPKKER